VISVNGLLFRHAPSIIARYMSEDFKNYDAIVQAFVKRDKSRLESLISTHEILLKSDRNWGLINELMSSYTRYLIKDLSMTYTSLSLRDMIRYCHMNNFDDIEKILFEMVKTDEITVQIDRENEIIRFDPIHDEKNTVGDQRESSEQLHMTLQQHLKLTSVLMERIGEIRNEMITSSAYVKRSLTMKK
jgi:26S proteasome regulatory subunit N3